MKLLTLGLTDTSVTNKEIETAVHKFGFTISRTLGAAADLSVPADREAVLTALFGAATISLDFQSETANGTLLQKLPLRDLAEISAYNAGVIHLEMDGANKATAEFTVEVALDSAFKLDDETKLMLNIDAKPNGSILELETIEYPTNGQAYVKYDTKFINANVAKDYQTPGAYALAVPTEHLANVELQYNNGRTLKLTPSEVRKMLRDSQDPVLVANGAVVYGFNKWTVISLEPVNQIRLTLSASTNFYLISQVMA